MTLAGRTSAGAASLGAPRWHGRAGRLEVWYLTATDEATGTGVWIHQETVAPTGARDPYAHGWVAVFPPDRPPVFERFGPTPATASGRPGSWHDVSGCTFGEGVVAGRASSVRWDLTFEDASAPLYTFPAWAWHRELLPGAQVVPAPSARVLGSLSWSGASLAFDGQGAFARINGHGSAQRWCWLHADLDGDGDGDGVLEVVSGSARRPGLRRIPPLAFVQLRLSGEDDWPRRPLLAAPRFRTRLRPYGFTVTGRHRGRTLHAEVELPQEGSVDVRYEDPDGAEATCRNSERATATITTTDRDGSARTWQLDGTAHAEIGTRDEP